MRNINISRFNKSMLEKLFVNTNFTPKEILEQLYLEAAVEENYYWSPANPPVLRCDVSKDIRNYFERTISIPFRDCGFLKTLPSTTYPIHKDTFRITALNMIMIDHNDDFKTAVLGIEDNDITINFVPYKKNKFTILNVSAPHSVSNRSTTITRTLLSIGFKDHSYFEVVDLYNQGKLFNVI